MIVTDSALILHSLCNLHPCRHCKNRKRGSGEGLSWRGSQSVGEDDAVPRLMGRGHSPTALHHAEGQMRTAQAWTLEKRLSWREAVRSETNTRSWVDFTLQDYLTKS